MSKSHVAMAFSNGMGNFIFQTAALKVLRNWGYDDITLITDEKRIGQSFMMEVFDDLFENIVTECDIEKYDRIFTNNWFVPICMKDQIRDINPRYRIINWHEQGIHEVQLYLEAVGAGWKDFDGYLFEPDDNPIIKSDIPRISIANCSATNQAVKKRWDKFPELSMVLEDLGYTVILLGVDSELDGCSGVDYINKLTVKQTAKVLQQCDLLISVSTGLSVVADTVDTPVLLLEGPMPTFKAHPIISRYSIVRKYISCAPCFQKPLWNFCTSPICMSKISVGDVLQEMWKFMPHLERKSYDWSINKLPKLKTKKVEVDGNVCYLVATCNRIGALKDFLDSFKASHPQGDHIIFVDDASSDPRVVEALQAFKVKGISKTVISVSCDERAALLKKYPHSGFSKPVYNRMIDECLAADKSKCFDYVMMIDSDIIMKPYWVQRCIKVWEDVKEPNVATVSGFSGWHPDYDRKSVDEVFEVSEISYRIRGGNNFPYLMSMDFLKNVHGKFDLEARVGSSDLSKNEELRGKGYKSIALVPSQTEHWGAFETSFNRGKPSLMSGDFI